MKISSKTISRQLLAACLALTAVSSHGATLALWDFTGAPGDQASQPVTTTVANITAGDVTRGSGITASGAGASISANGWSTGDLDPDDYYEFSITVGAGFKMDLDSVDFAERRSGTGIRDFEIRSSLDNYATTVGVAVGVPDNTSTRDQSLSLPAAFDELTGTVSFRIFGYNAESSTGTWRLANGGVGGLKIEGSVIPEPSSALLGALGFLVLFRRRR